MRLPMSTDLSLFLNRKVFGPVQDDAGPFSEKGCLF